MSDEIDKAMQKVLRKQGHSKLVYDKSSERQIFGMPIKIVDPHPAVSEVEKLMDECPCRHISLAPNGDVLMGPSYQELLDERDALAAKVEQLQNVLSELGEDGHACPYPINDNWTIEACNKAGTCGCCELTNAGIAAAKRNGVHFPIEGDIDDERIVATVRAAALQDTGGSDE